MMPTKHQRRQDQENKIRGRADEDPDGIMAEMSSLMTPMKTATMGMAKTTPNKTKSMNIVRNQLQIQDTEEEGVQQRIKQSKNTAKALNQAKMSSEAAVKMSKHELREVMEHRSLFVSKDKKRDVESLINSFYVEAETNIAFYRPTI